MEITLITENTYSMLNKFACCILHLFWKYRVPIFQQDKSSSQALTCATLVLPENLDRDVLLKMGKQFQICLESIMDGDFKIYREQAYSFTTLNVFEALSVDMFKKYIPDE